MPTPFPSETLLTQLTEGNQTAFGNVYTYYRTPALRFCYSLVKDKDEAENIVQDVFIKIWERRATINPSLNFKSYLFTCLKNLSFDYLKQLEKSGVGKKRYLDLMSETDAYTSETDEDPAEKLREAIHSLSKKRQLIFRLNIESDKSYQEIAEALDISKNTVKNQLVKAKQHLRERLQMPHYS